MNNDLSTWIGTSLYAYNVPYILDREKMKKYFHNLEIDKEESNSMSFFIVCYDYCYDEKEWKIHYHIPLNNPDKEHNNAYNRILVDENNEEIVFETKKEAEDYLIKLLDYCVIDINGYALDSLCDKIINDIDELKKELLFLDLAEIRFLENKK